MDINDKILRLYTRLNSLKQNLPDKTTIVNEKYVNEYHSITADLEKIINSDLSEFKVGDGEIRPFLSSYNYIGGVKNYTKDRFCDRSFLLAKLDALLSYFQFKYLSQEKRTIGFKKED
ncbi:MAG: hypothetical protein KJ661_07420 [Candidatus Omnitrophica bacterium]|nr:hypothetical protein [Candidatus Omnitrophota bacterium]